MAPTRIFTRRGPAAGLFISLVWFAAGYVALRAAQWLVGSEFFVMPAVLGVLLLLACHGLAVAKGRSALCLVASLFLAVHVVHENSLLLLLWLFQGLLTVGG